MNKKLLMLSSVVGVILATSGCAGAKDFFKALESKAYDSAAEGVSKYCRRINQASNSSPQARALVDRERVEARREIRQRGKNGPLGIGDGHEGPFVIVWCEGDPVPAGILDYLEK